MKKIFRILLIVSLTSVYAQSKDYERLSDKLIHAQIDMKKEYRNTSKLLNVIEKRDLRKAQHLWKLNKEKSCAQSNRQIRVENECKYKQILKRINFLKIYNPNIKEYTSSGVIKDDIENISL